MNEAKELMKNIKILREKIRVAGDAGDYKSMNKLMRTQLKLLELAMPYVKREKEPERDYPHLKATIAKIPPEIQSQILRALEKD